MDDRKIVLVPVSNLIPGMVAARDIYTRNDQLLIPKDSVIDENSITRIMFFGIMSVTVYEDKKIKDIELEDDDEIEFSSEEEKQDFLAFRENYNIAIDFISDNMNQFLQSGEEIDQVKLVNEVDKLMFKSKNRYHVFDMLHNIKTFDDETYSHSLNVAMINNVFADWLGMSLAEKNLLTLSGLLHDIGKLLIDKDILKKPSRLTETEFEVIKRHPVLGYQSLRDKQIPESVKRAVLLHHERCDGTGYPFGFSISEIDPYAAITAIADVYEAMTATRVYRKGMNPFDVIRILEQDGKKQFNPIFIVPILDNLSNTYLQHEAVLNDGRKGKIVLINKTELSKPMIMLKDGDFVDLSKERGVSISEVN